MNRFIGYKKGVNLGGWLSQCCHTKEHYESFITEADIAKIASWKTDHVRLPIDYNLIEDDNGEYIESGFAYIDRAVEWCAKSGLNIVIDLHKTAGYSFDKGENESGFFENEELQACFIRLWECLAKRYAVSDGSIAFELLNEVTEQSFSNTWNRIVRQCIEVIRRYAPDTYILVGGYWQNSPDAVKDLDAPYDDKVVYNFHCYDPFKFTHQGAYWVDGMDTDFRLGFNEYELEINADFFAARFADAVEAAEKRGAALYCGEYGVIDNALPEDRVRWFCEINKAFERLGISRAAWSYKNMDFGISDECMNEVLPQLINYL